MDGVALKIQASILQKHHCERHKVPCFVLSSGEHHQYTMTEISTWVALVVRLSPTPSTDGLIVSKAKTRSYNYCSSRGIEVG